jgi:type II secretory pathway component GspD/PulD (secretin)
MKRHPSLHALALIAALAQPTGGRSALAAQAADEAPAVVVAAPAPAAASSDGPPSSGLRFNFRGAPLEVVLQYLSEAAGFVIVLETPVKGTIEMWSAQPISREEAIPLLNLALNRLGYTATVQGRTLIVAAKDEARKRSLPVRTGNDPREIPANADMVMQVIPLRHITAAKVASDIASLVPPSATLTANEDSNSLVVTDTNLNVRHVVEIVSALDLSVQSDSTLKIFRLRNADPVEIAEILTALFDPSTGSGGGQGQTAAFSFPGMPPGIAAAISARATQAGGGRGSGGGRGNNSASRSGATAVNVVSDPRTQSVVITAPKDAMFQIGEIIAQLDAGSDRKQKVFVYTLENADVQQVEAVLRDLFQVSGGRTGSSSSANQADPLSNRAASNNQQSGAFMNNASGNPR